MNYVTIACNKCILGAESGFVQLEVKNGIFYAVCPNCRNKVLTIKSEKGFRDFISMSSELECPNCGKENNDSKRKNNRSSKR